MLSSTDSAFTVNMQKWFKDEKNIEIEMFTWRKQVKAQKTEDRSRSCLGIILHAIKWHQEYFGKAMYQTQWCVFVTTQDYVVQIAGVCRVSQREKTVITEFCPFNPF